jgi:hypothetical protein
MGLTTIFRFFVCGFAAASTLAVTPRSINFRNEVILPPNAQSSKAVTMKLSVGARQPSAVARSNVTSDNGGFVIPGFPCLHLLPGPACILMPGSSETFEMIFTPNAAGPQTGHVTAVSDASNSRVQVKVTGTGKLGSISLSPKSLKFPRTPAGTTSPSKTITLSNKNPVALPAPVVTVSGPFGKPADTCNGATVSPNSSCHVTIDFRPTAKTKPAAV